MSLHLSVVTSTFNPLMLYLNSGEAFPYHMVVRMTKWREVECLLHCWHHAVSQYTVVIARVLVNWFWIHLHVSSLTSVHWLGVLHSCSIGNIFTSVDTCFQVTFEKDLYLFMLWSLHKTPYRMKLSQELLDICI